MADLYQACNNRAQETCSRCRCSRYCSKACQKADWPTHKLLCRQYSTFDFTSRPSEEHFLVVLFSPDKNEPHLTWLHRTADDNYCYKAILRHLFPEIDTWHRLIEGPHILESESDALNRRELSDGVFVYWREEFFFDGSLPNRAVKAAVKERGGSAHFDWRGPIIVGGTVGREGFRFRDTNLLDFRHAVDFLRTKNDVSNRPGFLVRGPMQAVRINCQGAQATHNLPLFEPILVPLMFAGLASHGNLIVPANAGQPLRMRRDPDDPAWQGATPSRNDTARMLLLGSGDNDIWPDERLGSVVVIRNDNLPLDAQYLEAMVRFCQEAAPLFTVRAPRQIILDAISKPAFEAFYANFLQQKKRQS